MKAGIDVLRERRFDALKGKRILVSGTARTVRIDFLTDNRPTGKYYYQTHVRVDHASQIKVL